MPYPSLATNFHQREWEKKEEKAGFDILSKINILRIIQVLTICIHWNIEQLGKTTITYTQGKRVEAIPVKRLTILV